MNESRLLLVSLETAMPKGELHMASFATIFDETCTRDHWLRVVRSACTFPMFIIKYGSR